MIPTNGEGSADIPADPTFRTLVRVVDLLIAYSKRLGLLSELVSASERLRASDAPDTGTVRSVRSETAPRGWRIADRLSDADVGSLVSRFRAGTTTDELARQYAISKSSVKRLLRQQGVRRRTGGA